MSNGALAQVTPPVVERQLPPAGLRREAVIVLDDDPIMQFWSLEIEEYRTRLDATGAFSSITIRTLVVRRGRPVALADGADNPGSLGAGPLGPRAVFLVTHGRSLAWRQGQITGLLTDWARDGLVAVVNLLPQERWQSHGLRVTDVVWTPGTRAAPTATTPWRVSGMDLRSAEDQRADAHRTAVPILERGADWLDRWTQLADATVGGPVRMPALLVSPGDTTEPAPDLHARRQVIRFRATVSPTAFRLATRLAAAPLNARAIRAVQRMSRDTGLEHLTEVLTSALLRTIRPPAAGGGDTQIVYDFVYGVRQQLLTFAVRDRILQVQHVVENTLGHDVEVVRGLALRVKDPRRADYRRPNPATRQYLEVELAVHLALGGPNLSAAQSLRQLLGSAVPLRPGQPSPQIALPDLRQESVVSEVVSSQGSTNPLVAGPPLPGTGHDLEGNTVPVTTDGLQTTQRRDSRLPAIVGNLPLRNTNFTGRRELLDQLHQRLRIGTTAVLPEAVHGAGGVGKSQLVVEFVYLHQQDFDLIWWISAERPAQIQSALVELAGRLNLPVPATANTAVPAVLEALRLGNPYSNWLLIFDNAEDPEDVERFFPKGGPGSIVVTSRNPDWRGRASKLEVDVFDRQESIELMRRRDPDLAFSDADRLAEVLGDLPLAIEAAAAWRSEMGVTVPDYLEHLERSGPELGEDIPPEERDYPAHVAAVWTVTLNGLREREPLALRLLQLCAFFAPEPISKVLLSKPRGVSIDPELEPLIRNTSRLDRVVLSIGKLALARINHRNSSFQMHRLVQRVLIHQMDHETRERMRHSAHLLLAGNDFGQPDNAEHWPRYAELYPHIVASEAERCLDDRVRDLIYNEARYLWRWGEHVEARNLARRAFQAWQALGRESDPDSLRMAWWLGSMHLVVGDYNEARRLNARTLDLYREAMGEDDEQTLMVTGAVAADHRVSGDFAGALELSLTVYEKAVANFGDDVPFSLQAAHNLAVSMRLSGLYGRALQLDNQTYYRLVQIYGTDHSDSLTTFGGINLDRRELGDYVKAHADQETVIATARRVLKYDDHPDLLRQNHQLASFRRKAGRHQEALDLSSDVLRRFRSRYGEGHPDTVLALLAVSIDQRVTGDLAAARENGEKAVEGLRTLYGDSHPHTAGAQSDLAVTLRLLDRFEEARALNEEATRSLTERLTTSHALVLAARINLASDHFELDDFERAYELDKDTYARCIELLGEAHPTTLACGVNLAMDLRNLGRNRVPEASALFEEIMDKFRTGLGETHPATAAAAAGVRANCDIDPLPL
ncbi:FxSxx-COOH system tetratricopeptide repeat protein [Actinoplanes oblitus]|uniref:FxSxx-COOH system tetratricopeptide repeat protein n=1 Tax=Actinoplanes oblitus TaxID=3040509 RepID=A0ABY8WN84_9ACTN|nr:FxSxx-COOH system tetratricopeptide repeat protein [Actinoplanes oblitus]WIM99321.1 FxSxx-COOH system tetratricopeptide repeat protein [Actinoplanes oblitus]